MSIVKSILMLMMLLIGQPVSCTTASSHANYILPTHCFTWPRVRPIKARCRRLMLSRRPASTIIIIYFDDKDRRQCCHEVRPRPSFQFPPSSVLHSVSAPTFYIAASVIAVVVVILDMHHHRHHISSSRRLTHEIVHAVFRAQPHL
jgi:hypothetical protein